MSSRSSAIVTSVTPAAHADSADARSVSVEFVRTIP
jgi:hypothetical protein